jgi:hypothetical protein
VRPLKFIISPRLGGLNFLGITGAKDPKSNEPETPVAGSKGREDSIEFKPSHGLFGVS